jgi:hypothetical protein
MIKRPKRLPQTKIIKNKPIKNIYEITVTVTPEIFTALKTVEAITLKPMQNIISEALVSELRLTYGQDIHCTVEEYMRQMHLFDWSKHMVDPFIELKEMKKANV